jgi:hypothetical protein
VAKPYRGFESTSLRHAVWTAEKVGPSSSEICRKCPYLAIIPGQTGLQRTDCSAVKPPHSRLFSGGQSCSPVSTTARGECNAIRTWGFCLSELTFGGALLTEVSISYKPVSGQPPVGRPSGNDRTVPRIEMPSAVNLPSCAN